MPSLACRSGGMADTMDSKPIAERRPSSTLGIGTFRRADEPWWAKLSHKQFYGQFDSDSRYMQIREALSYDDVLLEPREGILPTRRDANITSEVFSGQPIRVPIIGANMPAVTNVRMANELHRLGALGTLHRFMPLDEQIAQFKQCPPETLVSIGLEGGMYAFDALYVAGVRNFLLDIAHGHHVRAACLLLDMRAVSSDDVRIMAGNVATAEGARYLVSNGAHAVKVGIGPGAACETRRVTGFGVPQLTAVMDCVEAVNAPICADGGIKNSGDIVKALAAGASTVMIGGLLAGSDEATSPGLYYGNASRRVNGHRAPEGAEGNVPLEGPVEDKIKELAWGLRSGISYAGARNLTELSENALWVRCSALSAQENAARI